MRVRSEEIYTKAKKIVRRCGTRDALKIAGELGIHVDFVGNFDRLLGMYTCRYRERHILLSSRMEDMVTQMVCAHEIGHDVLHRALAKRRDVLPEFVLFDMRTRYEYEANAFAAHICIDDAELTELMKQGCDAVQLAAAMHTNVNLMLIKLNEMNRMGWGLKLPYLPHSDFLKEIHPEN